MLSRLNRLAWTVAGIFLAAPGLARAVTASPGSGPEYVEYEPPIHMEGDLLLGGLVCFMALLGSGLLIASKRTYTGATLALAGIALGAFLMVCRIEIR